MTTHEIWMEQAFREAEKAFENEEVPIGAVIVEQDRIIGRGHNRVESLQDPTAHAEMIAITAAANTKKSWRLEDAILYVTKEPCPMCAGAIFLSRINHVVYAVSDARMGACGTAINILQNSAIHARVDVNMGILQDKCLGILQTFFKNIRKKNQER
ncbi:MAG: tRNA adenosine(34) deaminase TadA [bacterium]